MRAAAIAFGALLGTSASFSAVAEDGGLKLQSGRERIPGVEVFLDMVLSPGGYPLRTFITRPEQAKGRLPVIFMVGWLSCDSVEAPKGPEDGFMHLFFDLASRSGMATYRVDKPGVGDSRGPSCGDADFSAELAAYRSAFAGMSKINFIDTFRVYMLGFSNGGGFAPLVPGEAPVRGYMVFGGWYKTWLEHMLEHERRRMNLKGLTESDINRRMKKYATFYELYLNHQQTPGQITHEHPTLAEIWYDEPERQYGRPARFYHQLQALNLAEAWHKVTAPVLAVHGEYDWIMSGDDYKLLVKALNASRAGAAEFVEWPHADHGLLSHASAQKAMGRDPDQRYDPELSERVLDWLKKH